MRTENTTVGEDTPTATVLADSAAQTVDAPVAELRGKPVIDQNLIVDGLLFATPWHRCSYLGTSNREKPRWLERNKGGYRRLEDVLRESAQPGRPDNVGVAATGPNCETSSRDIRRDGDDNDNVSLVGTLPEHRSPSCQPIYPPPPPVNENIPSGSTQTKLLPRATETTRPKIGTNPLGPPGRKRGQSGSRQRDEQKLSAEISKSDRKLSPELMRVVLDVLRECPILSYAANKAGIHPKTLAYWIKRSKAGDDGYDVEWQGVTWRFHEHSESAIEEAHDVLLGIELQRAQGYDKILTWRGRVSYKIDHGLVRLGFEGPDAYLRDENGNPVPETVRKVDPKSLRWVLESLRPEEYGKNRKVDVPNKSGVLIIGDDVTKKPECNTAASVKARQWKAETRRIRDEKD